MDEILKKRVNGLGWTVNVLGFGNKLKENNGFSRNDLEVRNPLSKVAIEHFLVKSGTLEGAALRSSGFF